jgi:hypothetical protein
LGRETSRHGHAVRRYRLVTATVLLGSVALAGSAMAKPAGGEVALASAALPRPPSLPRLRAASEPASACTRKVKVVYAGYGEAARAGCPASDERELMA